MEQNGFITDPQILDSPRTNWKIRDLPGMNNKSDELDLGPNYARVAQNARFEEVVGAVSKRSPISYFNTTSLGNSPTLGLFRFYPSAKFVCALGNQVFVGDDATGTFTSIRTLTTSGHRMSFQVYKDLLICSNGFDNIFVYDGSSDNVTWELGGCKATIDTGTGITKTNVSYIITYDNDAFNPGAVSNTITSVSNQSIKLTNIPIGPIGTANRKIYRKDSGTAGAYRLVDTIPDNTTTTYTDTTNDVSSNAALPPITDEMPKGSILKIHRERLFVTGDPSNPSRIYYSEAYYPHYIQQTTNLSYMDISPEDNDEIMGIPIQLGVMLCFKKNSIRKLYITQPTSGASPSQWYAEDPIVFSGSPAQWSILQTPFGVVYLGWDHWYIFDGQTNKPILNQFDTESILPALYSDVVTHYDYNKGVLLAAYSDKTLATNYNNRCLVYNFKRDKLSYDTLNINCFASKIGDDETGELFLGDSRVGYIYQSENVDINYRLRKKSEATDGTQYQVFIGGTEDEPYIEIGSVTPADEIPDDICIFWDDADSTPGVGWVEVTGLDDRFIKISTEAVGTTGNTGVTDNDNDEEISVCKCWRVFRRVKGSNPAIYQFPDNAIVMFDQPFNPTGFTNIGYDTFIKINSNVGTGNVHIFPDTTVNADGLGGNLDNYIGLRFIRKYGEQSTWDGVNNYVLCLYYNDSGNPGNGWADVTDETYNDSGSCTADQATNTFTAEDHGLENNERVYITGSPLPSGINASTQYWVINATSTTWQVSLTQNGTAVDFTDNGVSVGYYVVRNKYNGKFIRSATGEDYTIKGGDTSEDLNVVTINETVHSDNESIPSGDLQEEQGSNSNVYDNDKTTYHGYYIHHNGDGDATVTITSIHTWITARHIDLFDIKSYAYPEPKGNYTYHSYSEFKYYYLNSEGWQEFYSEKVDGPGEVTRDNTYDNSGNGFDDVLGVKVEVTAHAYSYEGDRQQYATVRVYEVKALSHYEYVTFRLAKAILGKMLDYNSAIETANYTSGYWISPPLNIRAESFGLIRWHERLIGSDDIELSTRTAATETDLATTPWDTGLTIANGSEIQSSPNNWFQYRIDFTCTDTTVSNPRVYLTDDYVVKLTYLKGATNAEDSIEFVYDIGFRNFEAPMIDKIFKKFVTRHKGSQGGFTVEWECENGESGSFSIPLSQYPKTWESFFPSNAYGRELKIRIYKNDLYSFDLYEIQGVYSPQPVRD